MQVATKYVTEGLIQLTILLSLVGVRVDIDSYLSGYYTPLSEINLGASSAYIQTPFHVLRDTLDGFGVHPKCPELDYFFASRRLLDEVRTLGSPRFPTQLSAWLVHQVTATEKADGGPPASDDTDSGSQTLGNRSTGVSEHTDAEHGPRGTGACGFHEKEDDAKIKEEEEPAPLSQLVHSSTLEQENLLGGITALPNPARHHLPSIDLDQHWCNLLSVTDLEDLDSLVTDRLSDLDTDITNAISQDVSLHDAMVTSAGAFGVASERAESRLDTQLQRFFFQLESADSDASSGMALGLTAVPFSSVCNLTRSMSSHSTTGGCLDEAVFDEINQLGLEGLSALDTQLMDCLDPQLLGDLDSDSGLSLEMSSGGPVSPGSSEMSSSSSSYCEDEYGATGYSSEVDLVPSKGIVDHATLSPIDRSESVWHDHSYSTPAFFNQPLAPLTHKSIKEEPLSDDDGLRLDERELSRDELRARAMCLPFSVHQIVSMPVEHFLEVLDGHGFSPEQVTLLRDIRRRGKNKLAAQNCRKRKLNAITGLQEEVERLQVQRDKLLRERQLTAKTMGAIGHQIKQLIRDVVSRLRDRSGQPLDPERFTLQCGADGRVVVLPVRRPAVSTSTGNKTDKRKKGKKQ
ncbi:nuclear factor erythroid 2-related factor 3 [Pholidichthys leucotaenia]